MITLKSLRAKQTSKVKFLLRSAQSSELSVISDLQILQKQVAVYQILNGTKKTSFLLLLFQKDVERCFLSALVVASEYRC